MKLLIHEYPLQVLPTLAREIGLNEAIVLQQIHYWLNNQKSGKVHEGRRWIYNSVREWQEKQFPFWSEATVRRILLNLEEKKLILSANLNARKYDRTQWYTIDYDAILKLEESILHNEESILANCDNAFTQIEQMHLVNLSKPIPETTTEINQKIIYSGANGFVHPDTDVMAAIKTAISKVSKTPLWVNTEDEYDSAAHTLIGWNATPEQLDAFGVWWETNGRYKGQPALKSLLNEWRNFASGVTVKQNGEVKPLTKDDFDLIEVNGEIVARQKVA